MLLHTVYPGLGGAGTVAISIVNTLIKKKIKIKNHICFFGKENINKEFLRSLNKKVSYSNIKYFLFLFGNIKFLKLLFRIKPNKIFMHNYLILPILIYKLFYEIEVFSIIHTDPRIIKEDYNKNILFKLLLNLVFKYSNKIILVNKSEINFNLFKKYKKKIRIINNPIDIFNFKNKKLKKNNGKFTNIGMACRLIKKNRVDLLLRSIKNLNSKKPFIKLFVAGSGKDFYKLKKMVRILKISKYVKFEGNLNKKDLIKFYNKIHIYVHISDNEFMSTSILQAMSVSLNVVASDLRTNKFIISASNKNLLVKNNILSISKGINKLTKYSLNIKNQNLDNRRYVVINNDPSSVVEKYIKLTKLQSYL